MPTRFFNNPDMISVPAFIRTGDNDAEYQAWLRDHPDAFEAGTVEFSTPVRKPYSRFGSLPTVRTSGSAMPGESNGQPSSKDVVRKLLQTSTGAGQRPLSVSDFKAASAEARGVSQRQTQHSRENERRAEIHSRSAKPLVGTVKISDAPFDLAAIDYDPRSVPLSSAADKVEEQINRITQAVVNAAADEFDGVSIQSAGTTLHKRFADAIRAAHIPGVSAEQTVAPNGDIERYGLDGAVRTDVIYRSPLTGDVVAIWDFKVGRAVLTQSRAKDLAEFSAGVAGTTGLAPKIPVRMIKVNFRPSP